MAFTPGNVTRVNRSVRREGFVAVANCRVSVDIGGTFTDVLAIDRETGAVTAGKVPSTPHDLADGVLAGLDSIRRHEATTEFLVHGTTQGLNAVLQRRGERVLLLATEGVGDAYFIARGNRDRLYDIHYHKPVPLVPRQDVVEIPGRLNFRGDERSTLDVNAVRAAGLRAREGGFGSIAVAFLFSYLNPEHELRARDVLREELGETFPITLSHEVAREWREYERTSSAVLDAYIAPTVRRYLAGLQTRLAEHGVDAPLHVMQSNGGIITAEEARLHCLQTLLSGPVGGTMGGAALALQMGAPNLICVDMGGTSFDVSLIVDGSPDVDVHAELEGLPLLMAVAKIHTIAAGGGSVAYTEAGGLRVGPRSAGADPGPACYGRGGVEPTVTDANLLLGRISPESFAGGTVTLSRSSAETAVAKLADELGLGHGEMAEGICSVINAKMAQAIRHITVERGIEARDYTILAYGGAGPMHACFFADELGIDTVVIPPYPGAFSAWGMLQTDLRHDFSTAYYSLLTRADLGHMANGLKTMEREGREALERQDPLNDRLAFRHSVDVRYRAQEYTLTIPLVDSSEPVGSGFVEALSQRFHDAYQRRYGHSNAGAPIEIVMLRTAVLAHVDRAPLARPSANGHFSEVTTRPMVFGGREVAAPLLRRAQLSIGAVLRGPALVAEDTATTVVPPRWSFSIDESGCLVLRRDPSGEAE
jgi:N-methylhydantoinase A